jgi:hypothetical protein
MDAQTTKTATVSGLYPRQWIKPEDLGGKSVTVKIASATVQDFFQPASGEVKAAIVLAFERAQRRMICNKTQALDLAAILGDDLTGWPGHTITLTPGTGRTGRPTITILEASNGG